VPVKAQLLSSSTVKARPVFPRASREQSMLRYRPSATSRLRRSMHFSAVIQGSRILTISSPQLTPYD
jgi:hypothetical protein